VSPAVYDIPADRPFLDALAAGLLAEDGELADHLVLLPSRRACLALRDSFLRLRGGRALLLPRLQPIGDLEPDELRADPVLELDVPMAVGEIRRLLLLTRLVVTRPDPQGGGAIAHEQAIRLAAELAAFLDELADEGVALDRLDTLVPDEHAEHWRGTLQFLSVLQRAWPELLAAEGALDRAARRARILAAAAERWPQRPPAPRVTAAGITGSIPAVARLLAVVAALPGGRVILPGLDREMNEADWRALGPVHPQWALRRLLETIGVARAAVQTWPAARSAPERPARRALWREVMRPAAGGGAAAALSPAALDGLAIVVAPDLASEALEIALRIRAALEMPDRRVALVTADRNLARRVAAELARWGVRADDSAGVPLDQSPAGSFLLLTAHLVVGGAAPATLLATLKHPLAAGGMEQGEFRRHVRALERAALRGPRPVGGLDGLLALLRTEGAVLSSPLPPGQLVSWLERIVAAAAPFQVLAAHATAPMAALLRAHLRLAEALAADVTGDPGELWAQAAGILARQVVAELTEAADALGEVPTSAYPALLAVVLGRHAVRPTRPGHPRVAILGPFESRLVQADLVLVGGLNESVWPRRADAGPWLNRAMRAQLGLPPVEQAIGAAAHDLVALGCAPEVVLSRARKDELGAPTTPSRWLERLDATLRAAGIEPPGDAAWRSWAAQLDTPRAARWPVPSPRPTPTPPAELRPRELWATDVETLMRDPYSFYARRILRLRRLEPIDAAPDAAERGQILHAVLADFVRRCDVAWPADPLTELKAIGQRHFAPLLHRAEVWALWWPRFLAVAEWLVEIETQRRREARRVLGEVVGETSVPTAAGTFRLRARADRIEQWRDGTVAIVDYKTGGLPDKREVESGRAPQLPIEALIAAEGGFAEIGRATPAALQYFALAGRGREPGTIRDAAEPEPGQLLDRAREGLARLLAHFADPTTPFVALPRPAAAHHEGEYDHLARVAEWRGSE
jgi:ATP-dependent helicase/nuclease subunit B